MPNIESAWRYQDAMLRSASGYDEYGNPKVTTAAAIKVRWEQVNREFVNSQGNTIGVDAEAVVDRDIPVGSAMWLGTTVKPSSDIRYVVGYAEIPDIKNRHSRRVVYLSRSSDSLPTTA